MNYSLPNDEKYIIQSIPATIYMYRTPWYDFSHDIIYCPLKNDFETTVDYYAALFHELSHWTGFKDRLNRIFSANKETPEYAFEELVAEMSSRYVLSVLQVELKRTEHSHYIKQWLNVLGGDSKFLKKARKLARQSAKFLISHLSKANK